MKKFGIIREFGHCGFLVISSRVNRRFFLSDYQGFVYEIVVSKVYLIWKLNLRLRPRNKRVENGSQLYVLFRSWVCPVRIYIQRLVNWGLFRHWESCQVFHLTLINSSLHYISGHHGFPIWIIFTKSWNLHQIYVAKVFIITFYAIFLLNNTLNQRNFRISRFYRL